MDRVRGVIVILAALILLPFFACLYLVAFVGKLADKAGAAGVKRFMAWGDWFCHGEATHD